MLIEETILLATLQTGLLGYCFDLFLGGALLIDKVERCPSLANSHDLVADTYGSFNALMKSADLKLAVLCAKGDPELSAKTAEPRDLPDQVDIGSSKLGPANLMDQRDYFPDRDSLLAELHHRVRNNLQIIISSLNLQLRELRSDEAIAALQESINRVNSFSLIQNLCYDASVTGGVDFGAHLAALREQYLKGGARSLGLSLVIDGPKLILPLGQAIPCSMAISELLFASWKYQHQRNASDRHDSAIHIDFTEEKDSFQIGIRGKPSHGVINLSDSSCLELRLCNALIGQLNGQIKFQPDANNHSLSRVLIDGPLVR